MGTHNYHFQYKKENHPKFSQICSHGSFSKGFKNEFETAGVNEPSGFEPLKFYCMFKTKSTVLRLLSLEDQGGLERQASTYFHLS